MNFNLSRFFGFCLLAILISKTSIAQQNTEQQVAELIESLSHIADENFDYAELLDRINYYRSHPLNLNTASEAELKEFMLLSPIQISSLLNHMKENGVLIDLLELQAIEHFDSNDIQHLLPFLSIGLPNSLNGLELVDFLDAKHDLIFRFKQDLRKRAGYQIADSTQSKYEGSPQQFLIRYRYVLNKYISAGVNLEKDAGEHLYFKHAGLFDYRAAYLSLKSIGPLQKLVIGDYDLQFGQGLSLWSGLSFGKSSAVNTLVKPEVGLKPYSSFNEGLFFRGLANTIGFGAIKFTSFYSIRKLDASLDENMEVGSLNLSGLHRTATEIAHQKNLKYKSFGGILEWKRSHLNLGLIAFHSAFDQAFASGDQPYNLFDFQGKKLNNYGLSANYTISNSYLFSEIAHSSSGGTAFLAGLLTSLSPKLSLGLHYRNYPKNYHSFFNAALSESSSSVNENAFYAVLNFKFDRKWEWSYFVDYFVFPWLKYGVDAPSDGFEMLSQLSFQPNKRLQLIGLYKMEQKQENDDQEQTFHFLETVLSQKIRLDLKYWINKMIQIRNRLETIQTKSERSFLTFQELQYKPLQSRLSFNCRFTLFKVPSYDSRIYTYQPDVLYQTSIRLFQNEGMQFLANIRYRLQKGLDCWLNYVSYRYSNLDHIGTGLSEITGNKASELKFQIRYQF